MQLSRYASDAELQTGLQTKVDWGEFKETTLQKTMDELRSKRKWSDRNTKYKIQNLRKSNYFIY